MAAFVAAPATLAEEPAPFVVAIDGALVPDPEPWDFHGEPASRLWRIQAQDVPLLLDDATDDVDLSVERLSDEGIVEVVAEDGTRRPIAARVSRHYVGPGKWRATNPLATMSDAELRGLRGVFIEDWSPELADILERLDLERCVIAIERPMDPGEGGLATIKLPAGTRHLVCRQTSWVPGERPWLAFLPDLRELRSFRADLAAAFDPAMLANASALERLDLAGQVLDNPAAIGALKSLRALSLAGAKGIDDLAFLRELNELRSLDLRGLAAPDFGILAELAALEVLTLDASAIDRFAEALFTGLKKLRFVGALDEEDETLESLRERFPDCAIAVIDDRSGPARQRELPPWLR